MDEYTADPYETELEAQKKLKKIEFNKARAEVSKIAAEETAKRLQENAYKKIPAYTRVGGYAEGDLERGMMGSRFPKPKLKAGGMVKSASSRADGCAIRGKTRA